MHFLTRTLLCVTLFFPLITYAQTIGDTARVAVQAHPEILLEIANRDLQENRLSQVESSFLPRVSLSLGLGREDSNNSSTRARTGSSAEMERRESSLTLSQMLFDGFDTHWRTESQKSVIEAARGELLYAASQLAIGAIDSHLALVAAKQQLGFHLDNLTAHKEIAKNVKARVQSGKDDRTKVIRIQARLSLSLANVEAARFAEQNAYAVYREFTGREPQGELQRGLHVDKVPGALPESLTQLLEDVERDNPLVRARMADQDAAESTAKSVNSNYYPSLTLESGASWDDNIDGVAGRNSDAFAMLRLRYDLYNGGSKSAERKQARLERQKSSHALDVIRRQIRSDAEQAWHSYDSSEKRVGLLMRYVEASLKTKVAYAKQFRIGQRSLINLLDAENELLSAQKELSEAQRRLAISHYQVLNLTGELLGALRVELLGSETDS